MLVFVQSLEYYMAYEVIDPNWNRMMDKIKTARLDITKFDQVGHTFL